MVNGKKILVAAAALSLALATPGMADYPSAAQNEIAHTANYVGGDACQACHADVHAQWKTSWHTVKATQGPAQGKEFAKNIYEWVRRDWAKLDSHLVLDQKDKNTIYVSTRKYPWSEVDYVIGQNHKQRYMVYYDGSPTEAYEAKTENSGIDWVLDKSKTVQFAGNKERAGYHFLFLQLYPTDGKINKGAYGEHRSWQERCIGCHTTGFDHKAWDAAKADFVAGKRQDLRDLFVADLRISCEMCHGPGGEHVKNPGPETIIHPAKITDMTTRQMVCGQCHTRTQKSVHGKTAHDLRGYRIGDKYEDFAEFTRPAWGKGNRQVSIDGKGRRDHQQDMDIRLSATVKGSHSVHATMACFDCHQSHTIGNDKENIRLKKPAKELCATCHLGQAEAVLKVLDGRQGWTKSDYPNWATEYGRQPNKQHLFNLDDQGRSAGLTPDQYHWVLKKEGDARKEADWLAIWPWEKAGFAAKGQTVAVGAAPWN
ncbi:MAG: hypothetical protein IH614_12335 [Desulfuromonadales bacterium]|nr:hypothetical protein [Desulfuromonadales bacterium]